VKYKPISFIKSLNRVLYFILYAWQVRMNGDANYLGHRPSALEQCQSGLWPGRIRAS
jgi:hypothetical protein